MMFPKSPRQANKALLDLARGQPCLIQSPICNHNCETTVACHGSGVANGKGMGYKVSDWRTVWGCSGCNHYTDAYGGATADEKREAFEAAWRWQQLNWTLIAGTPKHYTPKERKAAKWALEMIAEHACNTPATTKFNH